MWSIVRPLGVQVLAGAVFAMALSQGPLDHWILPSLRDHVHVILVSLELPPRLGTLLTAPGAGTATLVTTSKLFIA